MISNFESPADNVNARAQRSRMRILYRSLPACRARLLSVPYTVGSVKSREIRTQLKSAVLAKRTQLDEAVKKFESEYFLKHGQLPQRDLPYIKLIKERNDAKAVLRTLNVSL